MKFRFDGEQRQTFERLKLALCQDPVLKIYRTEAETELHTDPSSHEFGAVLLQLDDEDQAFHSVYYASWKTTRPESRNTSYKLEVLAIVKSLVKFRFYLLGKKEKFKIVTDCKGFELTMNKRDLCIRVSRWVSLLESFNYCIEHRPG